MNIHFPWGEFLLSLHSIAALVCVARVLYKQRNIGTAFAWIILLLVFPILGVIAYLMVGEPRVGMERAKRADEMNRFYGEFAERFLSKHHFDIDEATCLRYRNIDHIASSVTGLSATQGNAMHLLSTTDDIVDSMLNDINNAEKTCMLAFYIIEPKGRVEALLNAVLAASARGVRCVVLADSLGSKNFFRSDWPQRLKSAGVAVQMALPVGLIHSLFTRTDLRNHRKLLIIDQHIGYTGSFNLVDPKFFKQSSGVGEWVDVMMRCTGPIVLEMAAVFFADIAVESNENLNSVQEYFRKHGEMMSENWVTQADEGAIMAQAIPSAPNQSEHVIYETIIAAIYAATEKITITTPYFVPDDALLLALTSAAKRGVNVTLILPQKVDSIMVRYASRAYYPMLLKAGVKIALFKGGLLHAKTMTIDHDYTLFGTVNMDMRSFFLNLEISLAIYDEDTTTKVCALQTSYLQNSDYISVSQWQQRAKWWGLVENTVRLVSPLL